VLVRLSQGERDRAWEASGLLDLLTDLEAGRPPTPEEADPPQGELHRDHLGDLLHTEQRSRVHAAI